MANQKQRFIAVGGVVVIVLVNNASSSLSGIMETSSGYLTDVTAMQAGSSLLLETSSAYVLLPTLEDGSVNTGPLMGYVSELSVERRGDQIVKLFENRNINFCRLYKFRFNFTTPRRVHWIKCS